MELTQIVWWLAVTVCLRPTEESGANVSYTLSTLFEYNAVIMTHVEVIIVLVWSKVDLRK